MVTHLPSDNPSTDPKRMWSVCGRLLLRRKFVLIMETCGLCSESRAAEMARNGLVMSCSVCGFMTCHNGCPNYPGCRPPEPPPEQPLTGEELAAKYGFRPHAAVPPNLGGPVNEQPPEAPCRACELKICSAHQPEVPTCEEREFVAGDEEACIATGPVCGKPARWRNCNGIPPYPVCDEHKCRCRIPLVTAPEVPCEFDPMYGRCRITTEHACSAKPEVPAPDWEAMVAREKNGYDEVKAPDEVIHLVNEHGEIRVWNAEPSTLDYIVKTFGLKPVRYVRSRS